MAINLLLFYLKGGIISALPVKSVDLLTNQTHGAIIPTN